MSNSLFQKRVGRKLLWISVVVGLLLPHVVNAGLVTRQFEFSSSSGPLIFGPNVGSFTYDDGVAPVGGGYVTQEGLLVGLDVSFSTFSFDETTANTGWLLFDPWGGLLEALFGTDCNPYCGISAGVQDWWIRVGEPNDSVNDFSYSGYNGASEIYDTYSNRLLPSNIPEPTTLALMGLGLAGIGFSRKRKQAA